MIEQLLEPDERELALALEHPRGTERRRLLPYRDALGSPAVYAALARRDRDVIARWAETRRRLRVENGLDHDPANLVDPLLPEARLRALVIEGEVAAAGIAADVPRLVEQAGRKGVPAVVAAVRDARQTAPE